MRVVVVGAGGHARSVIDAVRSSAGNLDPVACTDPDPAVAGTSVDGVPVLGGDEQLARLIAEGVEGACLGVGGVGDNEPRARLYANLRRLGFALPVVVHRAAHVAGSAELGEGVVVLAGAIVGPGARIAEDVIVNTGAIVEHDCVIDAHVHLASGCVLAGGVRVESHAHVGLAASVLQNRTIGPRAIVGAGSVVVHDVPADTTVVGSPAAPRPHDRL